MVMKAVSAASPRADDTRCATLLNALAEPTIVGDTAEIPLVMIGIMHRPVPRARRQSSAMISSCDVTAVRSCMR
jgi:hypothetical protein